MQTKLTLRLDDQLIDKAKRVATARGTSVSKLVSDYFRAMTTPGAAPSDSESLPPITAALIGTLGGQSVDESDWREHLETKHR